MKITLISVGGPGGVLGSSISEFETRARRYWKLEIVEVRGEKASKNRPLTEIRSAEAERIREAVPPRVELLTLTRSGTAWSSDRLARYLGDLAVSGSEGAAFVIGGAFGLDRQLVRESRHQLSLSPMTLPHDLARLLFAEQLYRAGTILRGEPYHKG